MELQPTVSMRVLRRAAAAPGRLARAATRSAAESVEAWVAARLLDAQDELALDVAIDAVTEDPEFHQRIGSLRAADLGLSLRDGMRRWLGVVEAFHADAPQVLVGLVEFFEVARCVAPLLTGSDSAPASSEDPLWFVSDPEVPGAVAAAILAGIHAGVALMTIEHTVASGGVPALLAPWLRAALVARWTTGQHEYLRLLASLPASAVSEDLVPAAERFNLAALERQQAEINRHLNVLLAAGEQSGQAVFTPFPAPGRAAP